MDKTVRVFHDALKTFEKDAELYNQFAWRVYEKRVEEEYETAITHARDAVAPSPDACHT